MHENCYRVLGIPKSASPAEVRAGFVRQIKRHHPDAVGADPLRQGLPRRLHDIQAAYRVLSDPEARARHDRTLEAAERHHFARQRAVQGRLRRYDRRHRQAVPRPSRPGRRPRLIALALAFLIALRMALHYLA